MGLFRCRINLTRKTNTIEMVCNNAIAKSPYRRSYLKPRSEKGLVSAHFVFISRYVPKQTDQPEGGILRNGLL